LVFCASTVNCHRRIWVFFTCFSTLTDVATTNFLKEHGKGPSPSSSNPIEFDRKLVSRHVFSFSFYQCPIKIKVSVLFLATLCVGSYLCDIVARMSHDIVQPQCDTWQPNFKIKKQLVWKSDRDRENKAKKGMCHIVVEKCGITFPPQYHSSEIPINWSKFSKEFN